MNKWVIAAVVVSLFALDRARADINIVDNLTNNVNGISGVKNAVDTSYAQGFEPTVSGNLNSLVMDVGLQQVNSEPPPVPPPSGSYATMSIYLYSANSSGAPITELATLATDVSVGEVESGG